MSNRMDVSTVVKRNEGTENEKEFWVRVGVAFEHKDGKGWSVLLDALPVNGKLTLRVPYPKDDDRSGGGRGAQSGSKGSGWEAPSNPVTDDDLPF